MGKLTKAKALKMTAGERREYMAELKQKLAAGEITRQQFETAREPIRAAIVATF